MKFTFGNLPSIGWVDPVGKLVELAQLCEREGMDRFGVSDWRFYHDCFVVMTACLQATSRLEVESLVTDPYVRHPSLTAQAFDGVFSATAFHWIDPEVGWAKAASHLKPGGLLALLTYLGLRNDDSQAIEDELLASLRQHAPDVAEDWRPPRELDTILAGAHERRGNASEVWDWLMGAGRHRMATPEAAYLFDDVEVACEVGSVEETADQLLAHLRTTSLYFRIEPRRRAAFEEDERRLVERRGGKIRSSLATVLMTARRTAGSRWPS